MIRRVHCSVSSDNQCLLVSSPHKLHLEQVKIPLITRVRLIASRSLVTFLKAKFWLRWLDLLIWTGLHIFLLGCYCLLLQDGSAAAHGRPLLMQNGIFRIQVKNSSYSLTSWKTQAPERHQKYIFNLGLSKMQKWYLINVWEMDICVCICVHYYACVCIYVHMYEYACIWVCLCMCSCICLCMCMCVQVYVCEYVSECDSVCVWGCTCIPVCIVMCMPMWVCVHVRMYDHVCAYLVSVCMPVCVFECVCVCECVCTCMDTLNVYACVSICVCRCVPMYVHVYKCVCTHDSDHYD